MGKNTTGITFDKKSFIIHGRRELLIGGEFHYFRTPAALWHDRILKMKRAGDNTDMPDITCSIGCCIASKGDTFEVLYKHADSALYKSKTLGKGLATIA